MQTIHSKIEIMTLEDRFENEFALMYETNVIPELLIETTGTSYTNIINTLIAQKYSLIVCLPRLPVYKELKKAEVLKENQAFKLLRIPAEAYSSALDRFLKDFEYAFTFLWIKHVYEISYVLPSTSQERIKLLNLVDNEVYSFLIENEECIRAVWIGEPE